MAAPNVGPLFQTLQASINDGEYEKGAQAAAQILEQVPDDEDAFKGFVACALHGGMYEEALKRIKSNPTLGKKLGFEHSYALYRLGKFSEAMKQIKGVQHSGTEVLSAQIRFRLGQYNEASKQFVQCSKQCEDDLERQEALSNAAAAATGSADPTAPLQVKGIRDDMDESWELTYNAACALTAADQLQSAMELLDKAEDLARETLESEELDEAEIEEELGPIYVQRAYILQSQGKLMEAAKLYEKVLATGGTDSTISIATNNLVVMKGDKEAMQSQRRHKGACTIAAQDKMLIPQQRTMSVNRALLALMTGKIDQFKDGIKQIKSKFGDDGEDLVLATAALALREKKPAEALSALQTRVESDSPSVPVVMTCAQLLQMKGQHDAVATVLSKLVTSKPLPGIVSAIVGMRLKSGDVDGALETLNRAVQSIDEPGVAALMLWDIAKLNRQQGKVAEAAAALEQLVGCVDASARAAVMSAMVDLWAQVDADKALKLSSKLPALPTAEGIDIDELEQAARKRRTRTSTQDNKAEEDDDEANKAKVKRRNVQRKKRKRKLPKNYDPEAVPDPERWLPKYQRSYFKKGKWRKQVGKGGQGAVSAADADKLQATGSGPDKAQAKGPVKAAYKAKNKNVGKRRR